MSQKYAAMMIEPGAPTTLVAMARERAARQLRRIGCVGPIVHQDLVWAEEYVNDSGETVPAHWGAVALGSVPD